MADGTVKAKTVQRKKKEGINGLHAMSQCVKNDNLYMLFRTAKGSRRRLKQYVKTSLINSHFCQFQ